MHSVLTPAAPDPLASLNAAQREAVLHGVAAPDARPLLIVAGAGTGKTQTLAHRVAALLRAGAQPQRLLLLTFSRRAADELAHRALAQLRLGDVAAQASALPWAGTFHAVGARLLREAAPRIGLDAGFTILDRSDAEDLMGLTRQEIGLSDTAKRFPKKGTLLAIYSRVVNAEEPLDDVLARQFPWCANWAAELRRLFAAYVQAKAEQNVLDYDDLLLAWAEMMGEPALAADVAGRFDHVLVDEYQDTNRLQARILTALKPSGAGVTVVGDDAQAIYGFRGATVRNILDFPAQFAAPARVVALERNYRSTPGILDVANAVTERAAERHAKRLWTEQAGTRKPLLVLVDDEATQARYVAQAVLDAREGGVALKAQAVLFRTSSHSAALELELARRDVPFVKFGGLKFLEAAHIKDVLALLRLADNPRGRIAGMRVLQLLPGIGPQTALRAMEALATSTAPEATLAALPVPPEAQDDWAALVAVFAHLHGRQASWPADIEHAVRWYQPHLERIHDHAPARLADLAQLQALASGYASRERFLTELTLDPPAATSDQAGPPHRDDDYLTLSTIHSAKGQEWTAVHVLSAVDGCMPSDLATESAAEIEEERRLFYVALTRAKHDLHVIVPQRFYTTHQRALGDRHVYAGRTRFIDDAMLPLFEPLTWPPCTAAPLAARDSGAVMNVRERLGQAWAK